MPCSDLLLNIFNIFGLKIGEKIGAKNSILLALFFEFISLLILLFIPKYVMVLFSMGIFGIGIAMNNLIITKNGWKYFPNKKGFVNGINMSASGISTSFLTPIADYGIINPYKNDTDSNGLYPKEIANRLPKYLYVLIGIFFIIGSISYFTTFNYEDIKKTVPEDINEEKIVDITIEEEKKEEKIGNDKEIFEGEKEKENLLIDNQNSDKNKRTISTKELLGLFLTCKNAQILAISIGGPCKIF